MFKKLSPVFLIFLIIIFLFLTNFSFDTWLTGWDNLHPEFNFGLNVKRSIFAVWQEYQGLGLLGGMGHASDLLRQIFLWLASLVLPSYFLRYFYHFLMLFLGPSGIYFLLRKFIFKNFEKNKKEMASLIGAIFYLFNLATLQMFYVPFEPNSTHFAFLPWLFFANLNFLNEENKKSLVFLLLVNIFSIPQGYVGTFFLVYMISLSLVFLFYFFQKRQTLKKILVAYLIIFCVNAFWLLPNLYFIANDVNVNLSAKINQMATENNILKNKKYGNLANATILKGFWFDNVEVDKTGQKNYMMGDWVEYLKIPFVLAVGYLIFFLGILGVFFAFKKGIKQALIFLPVFLFSFIFLANDPPIFSFISSLFYKIPLFYQIFRFPFTKFAILVAFCLSIFYSISYLALSTISKRSYLKLITCVVFALLPLIFLFPVFLGELFYFKNQVEIPDEYFKVIDYFRNQDKNTRIANFPQPTFWGWTLYRWNYSGSGFLWYGVEQPIPDRAFDVWSNKNENYYWEISYALYSKNQELFEKVLEKYQINWILVDGNVVNPSSPKALFLEELKEMLSTSNKIALREQFGKIKIYQVNLKAPVKDFVFLAENLPLVGPKYNWNNYDAAYSENGNYISGLASNIYYPFRSLFSGKNKEDLEFEIEDKGEYFLFKKALTETLRGYHLEIPQVIKDELMWVNPDNLSQVQYLSPEVYFSDSTIEVKIPKVGGYFAAEIEPASEPSVQISKNCNQFSQGEVKNEIVEEDGEKFLRLMSIDATNCSASFWLPNLPHKYSYLITIESRNLQGKGLLFWLENLNIRKADIETYLPNSTSEVSHFIQPPMEKDGLGYTLHFDNISIGREKAVNDLGKITVNLLPYHFLSEIKLVSHPEMVKTPKLFPPLKVSHPNPSYYQVNLGSEVEKNSVLVLSQAYHPGWKAYKIHDSFLNNYFPFIFGKKLQNHILVNNWENGWLIDSIGSKQNKIVIFFLPQILQYLGFLSLAIFFLYLLAKTCIMEKDQIN
jgi:hypothetical protein